MALSILIICKLIGAQGARLLRAQSGRRLTARPVESEIPGAEINYFQIATRYAKTALKIEQYEGCGQLCKRQQSYISQLAEKHLI